MKYFVDNCIASDLFNNCLLAKFSENRIICDKRCFEQNLKSYNFLKMLKNTKMQETTEFANVIS